MHRSSLCVGSISYCGVLARLATCPHSDGKCVISFQCPTNKANKAAPQKMTLCQYDMSVLPTPSCQGLGCFRVLSGMGSSMRYRFDFIFCWYRPSHVQEDFVKQLQSQVKLEVSQGKLAPPWCATRLLQHDSLVSPSVFVPSWWAKSWTGWDHSTMWLIRCRYLWYQLVQDFVLCITSIHSYSLPNSRGKATDIHPSTSTDACAQATRW